MSSLWHAEGGEAWRAGRRSAASRPSPHAGCPAQDGPTRKRSFCRDNRAWNAHARSPGTAAPGRARDGQSVWRAPSAGRFPQPRSKPRAGHVPVWTTHGRVSHGDAVCSHAVQPLPVRPQRPSRPRQQSICRHGSALSVWRSTSTRRVFQSLWTAPRLVAVHHAAPHGRACGCSTFSVWAAATARGRSSAIALWEPRPVLALWGWSFGFSVWCSTTRRRPWRRCVGRAAPRWSQRPHPWRIGDAATSRSIAVWGSSRGRRSRRSGWTSATTASAPGAFPPTTRGHTVFRLQQHRGSGNR